VKINNETKVGILATFAIVIVILGVNFLKGNNVFTTNVTLYAKFKDVGGLSASNTVMLYGVKIGQVDQLDFLQNQPNRVQVKFHVYRNVSFPVNSIAKINSDLLGAKTLEIVPGNATTFVKSSDTLVGAVEPSLPEALSKTVSPIKNKVEALVSSIDTIVLSINEVLNEKTKKDLKGAVASIGPTIRNIETTTESLSNFITSETGRFHDIINNIDKISKNVSSYNASITKAIDNIASMTDTIRAMNLTKTIKETTKAITNVNDLLDKVKSGQGTLGKLVTDDKLYYDLVSATRNIDKLVYDLKVNPHKYLAPLGKRSSGKVEPYKVDTAK